MKIDQSRYNCFHESWEKYRILYELNLAPKVCPFPLDRGIAFHLMVEWTTKGESLGFALNKCREEHCSEDAIESAVKLWEVFSEYNSPYEVLASEVEFEAPIPFTPHSLVGKIDRIVKDPSNDEVLVQELKGAGPHFYQKAFERHWKTLFQASTEILGARALGLLGPKDTRKSPHQMVINKVNVIAAADLKDGPRVFTTNTTRNEHDLAIALNNIAQTCEVIEMLRKQPGIDVPWVHQVHYYPSACIDEDKCEFSQVCGTESWRMDKTDFRERKEHLQIMRDKRQ